ncbi:MAG: hypothetical protein ACRC3H_07485 [Lachnospiraceae bacterium]
MNKYKARNRLKAAAIFSLYLIGLGTSAVIPATAKLAAAFPGHDYNLISTIPTLAMIPGIIMAGYMGGKRLKYRTLAVAACILYLVGGIAPVFLDNFT